MLNKEPDTKEKLTGAFSLPLQSLGSMSLFTFPQRKSVHDCLNQWNIIRKQGFTLIRIYMETKSNK